MKIFNINSKIASDIEFVKKYIPYGFVFNKILKNMDIFIVDGELMDILYPPVKEPEMGCADEMVKSTKNKISALRNPAEISIAHVFDEEIDKNNDFADISDILGKCEKLKYNATGFYVNSHNINNIFKLMAGHNNSANENVYDLVNNSYGTFDANKIKKAIFICYERLIKSSLELKVNGNTAFLATLFHELTHAYMDSSKKLDHYIYRNRIIEESLCEAMAYKCFSGTEFNAEASKFIFQQDKPLSYKCGIYISELSKSIPLISIVNKWKNGNVKGILFYFYEFEKLSDDLYEMLKEGPFFNRINVFYNIANRSNDYAANMLAMIIVCGTSNITG